ncbi:MAG: hypothetical protein NZ899_02090 [Thermoguttaceae bacterium]|nr:hypothetical protein [Thermoguttaceae bacterium]MDW8078725.1 hypothetical protein [Thermoguttaceae bacterium]
MTQRMTELVASGVCRRKWLFGLAGSLAWQVLGLPKAFGQAGSAGLHAGIAPPSLAAEKVRQLLQAKFSVRKITRGPRFHWFGYYDKWQFDPTDRYLLGMEVTFDLRSPRPEDEIRIGMIDTAEGDRWIELDKSSAWCWQQGCMLQWLPGSQSEIIWNDRSRDGYVSHILDVKTGRKRTLPLPVYAVSPDSRWAVTLDFRRLAHARPGYGYAGFPDPFAHIPAPAESGIWWMDLVTGDHRLVISLADLAAIPFPKEENSRATHWFNHLLVSPGGERFVFLHRWRQPGASRWLTRMVTAGPDGSGLRILDDNGVTSHFIWRDASHILAWSGREAPGAFYVFADTPERQVQLVYTHVDGHCSYLPGGEWIVCDTYPDADRLQHVYLYHVPSGQKVPVGSFYSPPQFAGEWRCDTHPRVSRSGKWICIDSPDEKEGRQMLLIDLSPIWEA